MNRLHRSIVVLFALLFALCPLYLSNSQVRAETTACLFLSFDDAILVDDDTAIPILKEYGWVGVAFFATLWQFPHGWEPYIEAGWEIGDHTYSHPDLNKCSASQLQDEIVGSKEQLETVLGVEVVSFAFPYGRGKTNETVLSVVRPNYEYIRIVTETNFSTDMESYALENTDEAIQYVKTTGENAWLMFHAISDTQTVYATISVATFRAILDKIRDSGVRVSTPSQLGQSTTTTTTSNTSPSTTQSSSTTTATTTTPSSTTEQPLTAEEWEEFWAWLKLRHEQWVRDYLDEMLEEWKSTR